ncbi:hypothetical protein [Cellulomonas endophytica]|uniref:hypothetical protein n=1 Tax=Cellulomonas endophytica TaxID=2494735 RepID=UPI00101051E2|nr:hypothetical protein [Cellulomonas endophytica]
MQLRPMMFPCPQHPSVDLTGRVRTALQQQTGPRNGYQVSPSAPDERHPHPFSVHVACPGSGQHDAHTLTTAGTYVP